MNFKGKKWLVPNWYDKEDLASLTGEKITKKSFEEFCSWLDDSGISDEVSELVGQYWREYEKEKS